MCAGRGGGWGRHLGRFQSSQLPQETGYLKKKPTPGVKTSPRAVNQDATRIDPGNVFTSAVDSRDTRAFESTRKDVTRR